MTPEEAFRKWYFSIPLKSMMAFDRDEVAKAAWLEATRQAYEDAARICESDIAMKRADIEAEQNGFESALAWIADAILQRAKE